MSVRNPTATMSARRAQQKADGIERTPAFEGLARAGFVARAVVYGIIGILAVKLAVGSGGKTTDQTGALKTLANQPFGKVLLVLVAIGLAGYSLWRLAHAVVGHGPERSDSTFDRVSALGSGITYGAMCAVAVGILLGSGGGTSGSGRTSKAAAGVLGWPGGTWLVALAGAFFVGIALYQLYRGLSQDFLKDAKTEEMGQLTKRSYVVLAVVGHVARAVVFGLVGVFLIKAAIEFDPSNAVGLDGALAKLAHQSYGSVLLGIVAAGLVAFALYSLADSRYRRI
jgi:fumarate reductase subunit D